jgi:hypothetical protein
VVDVVAIGVVASRLERHGDQIRGRSGRSLVDSAYLVDLPARQVARAVAIV